MLLAVSSAFLLVLSYPPFDLGWLAWVALIPWLVSLETATPRQAFLKSYLVGFLFFAGTLWWIGYVTVIGAIALVAYLALYFGAWGWFAQRILSKGTPTSAAGRPFGAPPPGVDPPLRGIPAAKGGAVPLLALSAAWCLLEYLRSHLLSGFGWNLLAHTQWNWIRLIQIADVTGVWGVSFLVLGVNVALWKSLRGLTPKGIQGVRPLWRSPFLWMAALCMLGALGYGKFAIQKLDACSPMLGFKVALVQGNIPQTQKWDETYQEAIWKRYEELTVKAAAQKQNLIVWPETALPGFLEEVSIRGRLNAVLASAGTPMLVGVPTETLDTTELHNSAVLFSPEGTEKGRHHKLHLVPFGEFVPLKPVFGWLNNVVPIGDFSAGHEFTVFRPEKPVEPFSVLICFEDLFPGMSRRFVRAGARWLLVITNDGWFGRSAASLQHLQCSVFRAVEDRVWIGRAANTGWTGFIDPLGRRVATVPRFKPGVAVGVSLGSAAGGSGYLRWGDWLPLLCLGLAVWAIIKPFRLRWKPSIS